MSKLLVTAGWDHVPHLDSDTKKRLLESFPVHERAARTRGEPMLGSGLIFPVEDEQIVCYPFPIPAYWPRVNGIDFGWDHPTGVTSLAWDRDADVIYVTKEFRARESVPALVSTAVKPWGDWIPTAWPHDGMQHDKGSGDQLAQLYRKQGLAMMPFKATHAPSDGQHEGQGGNGVEAGVQDMYERMISGRWKVFKTCQMWLEERRTYHRKDGLIVKLRDDLISSSRYAYMMRRFASVKPIDKNQVVVMPYRPHDSSMAL